MIKPKTSVFFDTNSYRQIVLNKSEIEIANLFEKIKIAEHIHNIKPISTQTVTLELMANLVEEENGINYQNCLESLRFLSNHCYDFEKKEIRISAIPYLQVSAMIFGALPIDYDKKSKNYTKLLESFISYKNKPRLSNDFYEFVKTNLTKHEESFSKYTSTLLNAAKFGIKELYPKNDSKYHRKKLIEYFKSDNFSKYLSEHLLKIVAKQLEIKLDEQELKNRAYFLRTELPLSVGFPQWILSTIVENNINMNSKKSKAKRWNWLWDYQISFIVSKNTINDGNIILVTSDTEIVRIIKENQLGEKVMDFNQYLSFLEIFND